MKTLFKLLRTVVFFALYVISILVFTPLVLLGRLHSIKYARLAAIFWTKLVTYMAKWICGIKWRVHLLADIPSEPVIYLSKHQSTWETFFLRWYLPDAAWVAKKELSRVPFFGWAMAATNPIFIDRKAGKAAFEQLLDKSRVSTEEKGESVLLFPEGTRQRDYNKPPVYKFGGAKLSAGLGIPVVPISHNAGYYWPRKGLMNPGTIDVYIGDKIYPAGKDIESLNNEIKNVIESRVKYL